MFSADVAKLPGANLGPVRLSLGRYMGVEQALAQQGKALFKTCAKPVQTTRQNNGITFHSKATNPQAVKLPATLSPTQPARITHNRTHFLHSFVDKITEVANHLSKTSTAPTTTITTYI
jgi:hypothetical protein